MNRMDDLISRQAAIDALDGEITVTGRANAEAVRGYANLVCDRIKRLPSAQPEIKERTEEFAQNVPKEDLISRKAAIEAMSKSLKRVFPEHRQIAEKCLNVLPSAQPEIVRCKDCKLFGNSEQLPSAQPEIIRCKDCKWYGRADKRRFYRGTDCLNHRIDTIVPDKDYCSRAERRTDE